MTILRDQAESILRQALAAPVGIQIRVLEEIPGTVTPSLRVKQILYRFRKEIGDVDLKSLQIWLCPHDPDRRLWIVENATLRRVLGLGEREIPKEG